MKSGTHFLRFIFSLILICFAGHSYAQHLKIDTIKSAANRTLTVETDSLTKKSNPNGLNSEVKYKADTIWTDRETNITYLYGNAQITYEDFDLVSDYVRMDNKTNTIFASGVINRNSKRFDGRPIFKQGSEPPITTDSLVYNFKTKRGKTYGVKTEVDGGYLLAKQFKKNEFDEGHFKGGIYTTCNLDHPHFGIHITRGIVTEKNIVTGPAILSIEDVYLPLGVPFGFFPKPNRRASGIMFPTFGEDQRGFYLQNMGYYIGLNDYWDATITGSIWSKGSFQIGTQNRYRKNYKYDGSINFQYMSSKNGIEGTPSYKPAKDFRIIWSHSQRPEANPGTTFSASVNAGTSSYTVNSGTVGNSFDQLVQNSLSSSVSYGKVFANGLFNFTSSATHNQELSSGRIDLSLPRFNLSMTTLNPFDSKKRVGEQKWYQRINVGYSMEGANNISTFDSLLFRRQSLSQFQNGIQHTIPVGMSLNVMKFFQLSGNINYNEKWYSKTIEKRFTSGPTGREVIDTVPGFKRAYQYTIGASLSTKVYGQFKFKKGKITDIRHVMTPSISYGYTPDFSDPRYGFYKSYRRPGDTTDIKYSIFEQGMFGSPGAFRSSSMSFFIENNVEAKVKKIDSTSVESFEKIPLLQSLSFTGSYNFAAPTFKLSTISFSGRTAFFKQKLGINFFGSFDPYQIDNLGKRINSFTLRTGKVARLTSFGLSTDFSLNSQSLQRKTQAINTLNEQLPNATPQQLQELSRLSTDPNAFVDFNVPWNLSASYSFQYNKPGLESSITNTLNFFGDFSVTPKWKVQFTSGYDFQSNKVSLTQFSIYRDLHCWDLSFRWLPFGMYKSYSVDLRVRSSVLQDLKLSRRRDSYNNF